MGSYLRASDVQAHCVRDVGTVVENLGGEPWEAADEDAFLKWEDVELGRLPSPP